MKITRRSVRVVAIYILITCIFLRYLFHNTDLSINSSIESSVEKEHNNDNDKIILCGHEIKDMPQLSSDNNVTYGVYNWNRNMANAIVIENRTDNEFMYGRTGNQIREVFHAFDLARDSNGALVFHSNGFPMDLILRVESISMQGYGGSGAWGQGLFLGVTESELEKRLGVTFYNNVDEKYRSQLKVMKQDELYHYISKDSRYSIFDAIEHRHYMIRELYQMTANEMELHPDSKDVIDMCSSIHALFGKENGDQQRSALLKELGITKPITEKYTVIHSRKLEGLGKAWMNRAQKEWGVDNRAGIDYPTDMITSILSPINMVNNSILMITDGQNPAISRRLASDPIIGKQFQVVPRKISTVTGDLLLAIVSDVFIGNPISTFSQYIVQVRYAFGIGNSYLFVRKDENEKWETFCNDEACFYAWINLWTSLF